MEHKYFQIIFLLGLCTWTLTDRNNRNKSKLFICYCSPRFCSNYSCELKAINRSISLNSIYLVTIKEVTSAKAQVTMYLKPYLSRNNNYLTVFKTEQDACKAIKGIQSNFILESQLKDLNRNSNITTNGCPLRVNTYYGAFPISQLGDAYPLFPPGRYKYTLILNEMGNNHQIFNATYIKEVTVNPASYNDQIEIPVI